MLHEISAESLVSRALRGMRNCFATPTARWVVVGQLLGLGSTYARDLCRLHDLDPDEVMPRGKHIREN